MTDKIDQLGQKVEEKTSQLEEKLQGKLEEKLQGKLEENISQLALQATITPIFQSSLSGGKTTWESYNAQFEIVAELNDWNVTEKAAFLATCLEGSAVNVLGGVEAPQLLLPRNSYGDKVWNDWAAETESIEVALSSEAQS